MKLRKRLNHYNIGNNPLRTPYNSKIQKLNEEFHIYRRNNIKYLNELKRAFNRCIKDLETNNNLVSIDNTDYLYSKIYKSLKMSNLLFKKGETPLRYTFAWQYANTTGNIFDIETLAKTDDKKEICLLVEFFNFQVNVTIPLEETFISMGDLMGNEGYFIILSKALNEITKNSEFNIDKRTILKYHKKFLEITDKAIETCNKIYTKYTGNTIQ